MIRTSNFVRCLALGAGLLFLVPVGAAAPPPEPSRILFLHLRLEGERLTLLGSRVRPGALKAFPPAARPGEFEVELVSGRNELVWAGGLDDPRVEHLEFEDPARPGTLIAKEIRRDPAEFVVRAPYRPDVRALRLFRRSPPRSSPAAGPRIASEIGSQPGRQLVGQVAVVDPVSAPVPPGIVPVLNSGPAARRINIVVLSEGYTSPQLGQFTNDARRVINAIVRSPPFDAYSNHFNGFAIPVASAESGSDHPSRNVFRDTYFNSTYDSFGTDRLVTIPPNDQDPAYANGRGKVLDLLQTYLPEYDIAVVIVNDSEYGGSGGVPLITSVNSSSSEIAVHELGHSFSGLGDEYSAAFSGGGDREHPNTTREIRREFIKWRSWILASTPVPTPATSTYAALVGLFEGANYQTTGWYRPKLNCKMRSLGVPFCEVCAEALVKSVYGLVTPIESFVPSILEVFFDQDSSQDFSVELLAPASHTLAVQWSINGQPVGGATGNSFTVSGGLGAGTHLVHVQVSDPTSRVRNDPAQVLHQSQSWTVQIRPAAPPRLEIVRADSGTVILAWPAPSAGYVLESTAQPAGSDASWQPVTSSPFIIDGRYQLTVSAAAGARFYRLRR